MRSIPLGIAAATLSLGVAFAQTTAAPQNNSAAGTSAAPMTGAAGTAPGAASAMGNPGAARSVAPGMPAGAGVNGTGMTGTATTPNASTQTGMSNSGANSNGAVNTSSANNPTPATGANSFTRGEARRRIAANGFTNVSSLQKDHTGVWRGKAQKGGQSVNVWLDYRGNVGQD